MLTPVTYTLTKTLYENATLAFYRGVRQQDNMPELLKLSALIRLHHVKLCGCVMSMRLRGSLMAPVLDIARQLAAALAEIHG